MDRCGYSLPIITNKYVRKDVVAGFAFLSLSANGFLALALHDAHNWVKFHSDERREAYERLELVKRIDGAVSFISSRLPNNQDK